jgi:hypothetical protein
MNSLCAHEATPLVHIMSRRLLVISDGWHYVPSTRQVCVTEISVSPKPRHSNSRENMLAAHALLCKQ